jgi:RNA 3'-terminal phosphate cyclase (ATP)
MLEIDGSMGEGGGQVLRTALSFACIRRQAVRISSIRAGRGSPGLAAQHLAVCNLLAKISGATVRGAKLGSTELVFEPGEISGGHYEFDIGTAGSCTLLLQAALPALLCAKSDCSLEITGGTHVPGAPTYEYLANVFLPAIRKFGARCQAGIERAGFYPKGGGRIWARASPSEFSGAEFARQEISGARYCIVSGRLPAHVAQREAEALEGALGKFSPEGSVLEFESASPGNAITVWSGQFGASALGERGKSAESVAGEACAAFLGEAEGDASVDSRLADQLLLYAALAEGKSSFCAPRTTRHLSTNADLLRQVSERDIRLGADGIVEVF